MEAALDGRPTACRAPTKRNPSTSMISLPPSNIPLLSLSLALFAAVDARAQVRAPGAPGNGGTMQAPTEISEHYDVLDRVEGSFVMLNSAPIRPMTVARRAAGPADDRMWVVNTNDSTIEAFDRDGSSMRFVPPPAKVVRGVAWGPVSIASWNGRLLVVCRNSRALVTMDEASGEWLAVTRLPAEPGDIVVADDRAYISCMGADCVVQVNLNSQGAEPDVEYRGSFIALDELQFKSPLFLSVYSPGAGGSQRIVVSMMHSGNNSTSFRAPAAGRFPSSPFVADLKSEPRQLPDIDLFIIDPDAAAPIQPFVREAGTSIFAHGFDPVHDDLWILNTEAHNTHPGQSEPAVNGAFVDSRLTPMLDDVLGVQQRPVAGNIELFNNGGTDALGHPFALTFDDNFGYVCGMLTDNIWKVSSDGNGHFTHESWALTEGAIPRGVLADSGYLYTYCWGNNEIEWHLTSDPTGMNNAGALALNHDPTPADIARGRQVYFDGGNSRDGTLSCASCHIDGGVDFLAWNLSNWPFDDKGALTTQTLVGINRMMPFHWRGERTLRDFAGAFHGLLGLDEGVPIEDIIDDIEKMEQFILALRNPANPYQHPNRRVYDDISHPTADAWLTGLQGQAVRGQRDWNQLPIPMHDAQFACGNCHQHPLGTSNDIFAIKRHVGITVGTVVGGEVVGREGRPVEGGNFKVGPFHELWRKFQPIAGIVTAEGSANGLRPMLGTSISHAGLASDLMFDTQAAFGVRVGKMINFLTQWDQGLAPSVHYTYLLEDSVTDEAWTEHRTYIANELRKRNCDMVVICSVGTGVNHSTMRWFYDRQLDIYTSEDGGMRSLAQFFDAATAGVPLESCLFVGLPVGMGQRFGVDYDSDGIYNRIAGEDPYDHAPLADSVAPALIDDPVVDWVTTRVARLRLQTNEPTTVRLTYTDDATQIETVKVVEEWSRDHSLVLDGLRASTNRVARAADGSAEFDPEDVTYSVSIQVTDRGGNSLPQPHELSFQTADFVEPIAGFTPDPTEANFDPADRLALAAHFISSSKLVLTGANPKATVTVRYVRGGLVDGPGLPVGPGNGKRKKPAASRVVVGRVYVEQAGVPMIAGVTNLGSTLKASSVLIKGADGEEYDGTNDPDDRTPDDQVGSLLLALTGADGEAVLDFDFVVGPDPGAKIWFNIEAIVEVASFPTSHDENEPFYFDLLHDALEDKAYSQWDFPNSTEQRTLIKHMP